MKRKECDRKIRNFAYATVKAAWMVALIAPAASAGEFESGSIRLSATAVVLDDQIHLRDVCLLMNFDSATERKLSDLVLTDSPQPGGTRIVHLDMIRQALEAASVHASSVQLRGAMQCNVSRPADAAAILLAKTPADRVENGASTGSPSTGSLPGYSNANTLRQAVVEYFNEQLRGYGGTPDVTFDRGSQQLLELSGPKFQFQVRANGGGQVGLVAIEVEIIAEEKKVQTVSLIARVSLVCPTVVARRPINQGAVIQREDVEVKPVSFHRLDELGLTDATAVVGQKAKRFLTAGTQIDSSMIDSVPLVRRGQLVTLRSLAQGIRVVTTAKAAEDGILGQAIKVRVVDAKHVEFDGVVVGPGEVEVGAGIHDPARASLALGGIR